MNAHSTKVTTMAEAALRMGLAVVLSRIVLFRLPQDGSISLELVPMMILAWRRGAGSGMTAGITLGILLIALGGYVLHPLQALLDYPLAFACVRLAAVGPKIAGIALAGSGHILCSTLSGVWFFSQFAPEGMNPWTYSFFYNVSVLGAKYVFCGAAALLLQNVLEKRLSSH